jgi:hypothetical protein
MESKDWDQLLLEFYNLLDKEEGNVRLLWKRSYEIKKVYGLEGLRELSENLRDTYGRSRSHHTLRQYARIYEAIETYNIPKDIPFTVVRAMLGYKYPETLIDRVKEEGLNSYEIMTIINESKPKKKKKALCPTCNKVLKCPRCDETQDIQKDSTEGV